MIFTLHRSVMANVGSLQEGSVCTFPAACSSKDRPVLCLYSTWFSVNPNTTPRLPTAPACGAWNKCCFPKLHM